jgi:penicillin V acylase-like amidase (Ntn superfamily)
MKNRFLQISFAFAVVLVASVQSTPCCTTFLLPGEGRPVFGRNFDYPFGGGLVVVNKRNLRKVALTRGRAAAWVSKYGSVTFNLYGIELPMGGMNEAGLVIENMWLDETVYPKGGGGPGVNNLQWIQYQLDNFGTVAQVLAAINDVRINSDSFAKVHYLIADSKGDCAAIEFLDGKMMIYRGADLPVHALTNNTYAMSLEFLRRLAGSEMGEELVASRHSISRFVTAARWVQAFIPSPTGNPIDYAFTVLDTVRQPGGTQWSIVYDISERQIFFRTIGNRNIRSIDFDALNFSCAQPTQIYDIETQAAGDISGLFGDFDYQRNYVLVKQAFTRWSFNVSARSIDAIAEYPKRLKCKD